MKHAVNELETGFFESGFAGCRVLSHCRLDGGVIHVGGEPQVFIAGRQDDVILADKAGAVTRCGQPVRHGLFPGGVGEGIPLHVGLPQLFRVFDKAGVLRSARITPGHDAVAARRADGR